VAEEIDLVLFDVDKKPLQFVEYISSHIVLLLNKILGIDDDDTILSKSLAAINFVEGLTERIFKMKFSDYSSFRVKLVFFLTGIRHTLFIFLVQ